MKNGIPREKAIDIAEYIEQLDRFEFMGGNLAEIECGFWSQPDEDGDIWPRNDKATAPVFGLRLVRYRHVEPRDENAVSKAFLHIMEKFGVTKAECDTDNTSQIDDENGIGVEYFIPIVD